MRYTISLLAIAAMVLTGGFAGCILSAPRYQGVMGFAESP